MTTLDAVRRLRHALVRWTGLDCGRGGRDDVLAGLLRSRAAAAGIASADAYVATLRSAVDPEVQQIVDAITVGYTWFFRDAEQLEQAGLHLASLPASRPATAWVAGCASGEEAYSLAMVCRRPLSIVASDINTRLLEVARAAEYGDWSVRQVPPGLHRHLRRPAPGRWRVAPELRDAVRFVHHNLAETPLLPADGGRWDAILCRNVLVYFDPTAARAVIRRLVDALAEDGLLFLGSTEVVSYIPDNGELISVGSRTALRRRRPAGASRPAPPPPLPRVEDRGTQVDALLEDGVRILEGGDLEGSLIRFVAAASTDPLSAEARLLIGIAHHASGDARAAYGSLRAALFLRPDLWLASFYLARVLEQLGRPDEARREYRRVIDGPAGAPTGVLRLLSGWWEHARVYASGRLS